MTISTITADTDLLRQMRSGTAAAFQALYRRHQGALFRFALLRSGSADTAADIVQEVFMGLLTDSLRFDPLRGELRAFLFGVARNLLLKHEEPRLRHASLSEPDEEGELEFDSGSEAAEPLARMLDNEVAEEVRRALSLLPPAYRDVVILYELHDLSYLEVAAVCQIDIGTVRSRLSRGRAALAKRLAAHRSTLIKSA
ncbi:RNA polymerase sigma factor [Duganella sp.]|uniref:RNA polymerase sigma factor n=1 Tax=Duganella sp. TaxID=1904440 RepID=UPI0031E31A2C